MASSALPSRLFDIVYSLNPIRLLNRKGSSSSSAGAIDLPSVPTHEIETLKTRPARTLKHLLKANHANHSVIYNKLRFHNHAPHILGSAYILGATSEHLHDIYNKEDKHLEPWRDAPGEVSKDDWRDFWGKRDYQRAFIDFFEDRLVEYGYDWEKMLWNYLFQEHGTPGDEDYEGPLFNNMINGLGHPLIHLGYSIELRSGTIATEALTLGSCFYNDWHKYLDDPKYTKTPDDASWEDLSTDNIKPKTPLELLHKAASDARFDGLFSGPGSDNLTELFEKKEAEVLEYWNAWELHADPKDQFHLSQRAAAALLVATHDSSAPHDSLHDYDFFVCHVLTTSHAIRILLPHLDAKRHTSLVRQWWLFALAVYLAQARPQIAESRVLDYELAGRGWKWVEYQALTSEHSLDAHYVKACRAMKEAASTWGDEDEFFLKAAVKFASEFSGWGGFSSEDVKQMEEAGEL